MAVTRRQFGLACVAGIIGSKTAWARQDGNPPFDIDVTTVGLPDGSKAPALGMGSWRLAQGRHPIAQEEEALKTGISLGMRLIDTAESYGRGTSEEMIGRVIAGQRDKVFLVSKVAPGNAVSVERIRQACAASLARLGTDHLDIYLLHWRAGSNLKTVVNAFESLKKEGCIRNWGVSNFGVSDMEDLFRIEGGTACATNQVRYSLSDRRIETDLIPWSVRHGVSLMAYSPLGSGSGLIRHEVLARIAARHGVSPAAIAIAWTMRNGHTISIPESGSPGHIRENAAASRVVLKDQDLAEIDAAFPM